MQTLPLLLALFLVPQEREEPPPGFAVTWEHVLGREVDHAPHAALCLRIGEAPHPSLRSRGFTATFEGVLLPDAAGRYRFHLEAEAGTAELEVLDEAGRVLARTSTGTPSGFGTPARSSSGWVDVRAPGEQAGVRLVVRFRRAARETARLRTLWERSDEGEAGGFRPEPIPSWVVRVPGDRAAAVRAALLARRGRMLLGEKGCVRCHRPSERTAPYVDARPVPPLPAGRPPLRSEGLARWIRDPSALVPGCDMPTMPGVEDEAVLSDLVRFLEAGAAEPAGPADSEADPSWGRRLFHTTGCVACHGALASPAEVFDDPTLPSGVPDVVPRRPLGEPGSRWRAPDLAAWLRRPDGRMPHVPLSESEAAAIAAYLAPGAAEPPTAARPSPDDPAVERGARAFVALGCAICHAEGAPPEGTPALDELPPGGGCIEGKEGLPRYDLSDADRRALAAGIASLEGALGVEAPIERAERTIDALGCLACHRRDGRGGLPPALDPYFVSLDDRVDLGDEGRLPPDLTSVGFKLTTSWAERVVAEGERARPYLSARMPRFGDAAPALVRALQAAEGVAPHSDLDPPPASDALVLAGRTLAGVEGMKCVTCHSFRDLPPAGSPGPRIDQFAERLRYEWWKAYLPAPSRYKPGTRMPSFASGRRSTVSDLLGGDIDRQADALWAYFSLGEGMPPPPGVVPRESYLLEVTDRVRVVRTFLQGTGARGIAVGFPTGVHYGFDATGCRLTQVWEGDFLDISAAWAGRGGQFADGRGPVVFEAPEGPAVRPAGAESEPPEVRFGGYRLARDGTPTFLYAVGPLSVEETVVPQARPSLVVRRTFVVHGAGTAGILVRSGGGRVAPLEGVATLSPSGEEETLIVPLENAREIRFVLEVRP